MSLPLAAKPLEGASRGCPHGRLVGRARDFPSRRGRGCVEALEKLGARVSAVDAGRDLAAVLTALKPDRGELNVAARRMWGEDGCVQGVLEKPSRSPTPTPGCWLRRWPWTRDKAKAVLAAAGVPVPGGGLYERHAVAANHVMPPPYVVKPNAEGSSVGVYRVMEGANSPPTEVGAPDWTFGELVMVEPLHRGARALRHRDRGEDRAPRPGRHRTSSPCWAPTTTTRPSTPRAARATCSRPSFPPTSMKRRFVTPSALTRR